MNLCTYFNPDKDVFLNLTWQFSKVCIYIMWNVYLQDLFWKSSQTLDINIANLTVEKVSVEVNLQPHSLKLFNIFFVDFCFIEYI